MSYVLRYTLKRCPECGEPVRGRRPNAVYCGKACQEAHWRKAQKASYAPVRVPRACACGADITQRPRNAPRCADCQVIFRASRPRGDRDLRRPPRYCACGAELPPRKHRCPSCSTQRPPRACREDGCDTDLRGTRQRRCDAHRAMRAEERKTSVSAVVGAWQKANPVKVQFWSRRRFARSRGLEFAITLDDVLAAWPKDEKCGICGVGFVRAKSEARCPSIDRIDNTQGYTQENCQIICVSCNGTKNNRDLPELAERTDAVGAWARARLSVAA